MSLEPRLFIRHAAAPAAVALDLLLGWDKSSVPAVGGPVILFVLTGLVALPLPWRHAAPVPTLIAVLCGSVTVAVIVPGFVPVFATWIALFAVSVRCSRTVAAAALLASFTVLGANAVTEALVRGGESGGSGPGSLATAVAAGLLVHGGLFGLGRWVKWSIEQRRLVATLAARDAAAGERSRIARDLHDIVAHSVSLMVIHAGAAGKAMATRPDRAAESMQHITELGERAVGELRQMLGLLGGQQQEEPLQTQPRTSVASAPTLVSEAALAGLTIDFSVHGSPVQLSRETDEACYRIIQEAVTNALKHGSGGSARLALRWHSDGVSFELLNRGGEPGAAARLSTGHGLAGMTARAATAGGFMEAGGSADGFRVHARFPGKVPAQPASPSH